MTGCSGPDCAVTYTPDSNYYGPDEFKYRITTSEYEEGVGGQSSEGTIGISVTQTYLDAPTCDAITEGDTIEADEDIPIDITLICSPTGDDPITQYLISTDPSSGTLSDISGCSGETCSVIYDPGDNFFGSDSFYYQACTAYGA